MPIVKRTPQSLSGPSITVSSAKRARIIYGLLLLVSSVFIIRLFYLQVIRHDYYRQAALDYQLKEYQIPAERGVILAHNGSQTTPLVLNETKYTLFADPIYVKEPEKHAVELAAIIQGDAGALVSQLKTPDTRYVVLAKKLSREQHEKINELDIAGIGTREESYRTYPQGSLAAQILGFVNDDGNGQYGIEQALDERLQGVPGELKAITDARGVPLVSNPDNIVTEAQTGEGVTLTIDLGMQRQVEDLLKAGLDRAKSSSGSALIINPNDGAVKAMANYPSYDPANIQNVINLADFSNTAVSSPLEVGSIMKTLTAAAAFDQEVVAPSTSFYDEGFVLIGDRKITNVRYNPGTQTVESVLVNSLNTGAVWLLKQIGRGDINERARLTWYDYMTKHYFLGTTTGIEQAGEAEGYIPSPEDTGYGINVTYANTAFGQALTATPLQMAAAFSAIINGGVYYQPRLVDSYKNADGEENMQAPIIKKRDVVSRQASDNMVGLLQRVVAQNIPAATRAGYSVGGKTGTAEIARPSVEGGGYYSDRFNGTYIGFVGGDRPEYVIIIRVNEPGIPGFAGSAAAAPIFRDVSNMLLDNFGVTPKSQ
ncbi:penicillin-binding protein 2 [Candidatus Saccharibacteria bacterium]|nr:penicillin-binding protein 2 [Candidatus Saccharibacteria bacterium]